MSPVEQVEAIFREIRRTGNLIPRGHKTIGSFWAVDRWDHPDYPNLEVQLQDEGSTSVVILAGVVHASTTYGRPVSYIRGNDEKIRELYEEVCGDRIRVS